MKKILYSVMVLTIAAMTFTACEDVPEPYPTPTPEQKKEVTYEGAGTLESPYTVADAINYAKSFGQANSDKAVYIKGYITAITDEFSTQYGNATFDISDNKEGGNKFTFYRGLYLGNKKFTSGKTQIAVGDQVIIYGNVVNYKGNTPETVQGSAFLYSLNGVTEGGSGGDQPQGEATGDGTLANPFNAVAAYNYAKSVGNAESDKEVYIKGKVSTITEQYGTQYGNSTFNISDDGKEANEFTIYRAYYLGNVKYTSGDLLKQGDDVIVCGKVTCYMGNTPETVQGKAYLYSLNGKTEGGGDTPDTPTPSGDNLLSNGDFETWSDGIPTGWKSASTASSATLSQSSDAHGGSSAVKVGGDASSNKRLASTEIELKAGSYTFSFYAKSTTDNASQVRPGIVPVTDGKVGSYAYGDYASINNTSWTLVTHSFTLTETTTVCLVVMNPKTSSYATAQDVIIDDASLTTSNGGTTGGGSESGDSSGDEVKTITVAEFNAAAESTSVWYQLTGTVKNLKDDDQYGNFDLEDATGSVYVYGVLSEKGGAKKQFQTLAAEKGIKNGSTITIIGNRGSYKDKIEVTNAYFVSVSN